MGEIRTDENFGDKTGAIDRGSTVDGLTNFSLIYSYFTF